MQKSHPPTVAPLEQVRLDLGLSRTDFAATLGLTFNTCYNACMGLSHLPRQAGPALAELGLNPEALAQATADFLADRGSYLRARLAQGEN